MTEGTEKETELEAEAVADAAADWEAENAAAAEPAPAGEPEDASPRAPQDEHQGEPQGEYQAEEAADEPAEETAESMAAQLAEYKDKLLRAMAEMENVRRRARREKEDAAKYSIANFAREILQVADNLRRALESVDGEARQKDEALENLCIGVEMTERVMLAAFEQIGIKPIEALGLRFDHNLHEAMFEVENPDQPAGTVVQVMRGGYLLHDRLLRPVQVGVSRGGPKAENPESAQKTGEKQGPAQAAAYDQAYEQPAKEAGTNLDEEL